MALISFRVLTSFMSVLTVLICTVHQVAGLSCGPCAPDQCPTLACPGIVVDDACLCCKVCAKQLGENCGGSFKLLGICEEGLICELNVPVGESVPSDAQGTCQEPLASVDGTSSLSESSQGSVLPCEIRSFSGCNIINGQCTCTTDIEGCVNPFQFTEKGECESALAKVNNATAPEPESGDCSRARCEIVFDIQCPSDSRKIEAQRQEGECCPQPAQCLCDMESCDSTLCTLGYEYHILTEGNGQPGTCCDVYECRPIMSETNCNGVVCPESKNLEMCPTDSKIVMGGMSPDGCCILPSRCACALELCAIPVCSQGYSPRRISPGNMEPGSCCDVYECVVGMVTEGCTYNSHAYVDGESWNVGHCKSCTCHNNWAHCIAQQDCYAEETRLCLSSQGIKMPGERWDEDDCTMCECVDGSPACMTSSCVVKCLNPRKVDGICCPVCDTVTNFITMNPIGCPEFNCTLTCPDGYQRDADNCLICECQSETELEVEPTTSIPVTEMSSVECPEFDCLLPCEHGYKIDSYGCEICECLTGDTPTCPDMSQCSRQCPYGYRQDEAGCDTCRCQQCRPMDSCTKYCLYGYQTTRHGCLKCKCNKCPPISECKKHCTHGFEVNDRGCEICKCQASPTVSTRQPVPAAQGSCELDRGLVYDDGESWHDGCRQCYCNNGQEMCALITCPVPVCSDPVIRPGQCCPTCPDSDITNQPQISLQVCQSTSGHYYVEGETWLIGTCTSCVCHNGRVLCSPEVCPPLPCLNPVFKDSQCCGVCEEEAPEVPGPTTETLACLMPGGVTFQNGATWKEDSCTSCRCEGGKAVCFSQACPPVECEKPLLKKGQCCPTCLEPEARPVCKFGGEVYVDGETWIMDNNCTSCVCEGSKTACQGPPCESLSCNNPVYSRERCCPYCPDKEVVSKTVQPTIKTSLTDDKDFDATEPPPKFGRPRTPKPHQPAHKPINKGSSTSGPSIDVIPPSSSKKQAFPVYPVILSVLVILLACCIIFLLLLFVTKRRHRLLYHVNVKPAAVKDGGGGITATAIKPKNTDLKNSNRDAIRDSGMFKDNLPTKASTNVTLDAQDIKRYSDMFAVGKSIQPV